MFGSNDVGQMDVLEYETKTLEVLERSLNNGTVVILSTMPPRSGLLEKSKRFADAVRKIAKDEQVPLVEPTRSSPRDAARTRSRGRLRYLEFVRRLRS